MEHAKDVLIGEVAAKTGLDVRTIRSYEQVGVLPKKVGAADL
ncbi:MerR family DNA-binding transcriptional regulator [Acidobacteria bacterium AH-259-O06]|nr:MerR family DNA-binding transcriptional regulator [Acidobacteria bacterium AH-259-L09]MDA2929149.1 MerR family DNA-binding transcriptional regulator [Acidobacteria bacterium AH-259-O06]